MLKYILINNLYYANSLSNKIILCSFSLVVTILQEKNLVPSGNLTLTVKKYELYRLFPGQNEIHY
jgi:hypothetical protein